MTDQQKNLAVFSVVITIILVFLLFSLINFDPKFANIFLAFLFGIGFLAILNKRIDIPIVRSTAKPIQILLWSVGGYLAFIAASTFILPIFGIIDVSFNSLAELFSQNIIFFSQASEPVLAGNPILVDLAWGKVIPIAETVLFILLFEKAHDFRNIKPEITQVNTWLSIIIVSSLFTLFHLTAKGGEAVNYYSIVIIYFIALDC